MILFLSRLEYATVIPGILIQYIDNANYCCNCGSACFDRHIREITDRLPGSIVAQISFTEMVQFECYYCSLHCCNQYHTRFMQRRS